MFTTADVDRQTDFYIEELFYDLFVMDGRSVGPRKWTLFPGSEALPPYHIFLSEFGTGSQKHARKSVRVWQVLSIFMEGIKNDARKNTPNYDTTTL